MPVTRKTHIKIKTMIDFVPYSFCNAIMVGRDDDLPFRVELWDDKDSHIEEVLALASDYATGSQCV